MMAWFYVLCQASKKNQSTVSINFAHVERIGRIKEKDFLSAIEKLESIHIVRVDVTGTSRERDAQDTPLHATRRTNERDERDERDTTPQNAAALTRSDFDFESVYKKYPRQIGKKQGLQKAKTAVKSQADFDKLCTAVSNYSEYCRTRSTEERFIKHFSTFMTSWTDWIEIDPTDSPDRFDMAKILERDANAN